MFAPVIRMKKLKPKNIILVAAKHNHREIMAELGASSDGRIDPSKSKYNRVLRGPDTALAVSEQAKALMEGAGVHTLRKDAVRGLEVIVSLPAMSPIEPVSYFEDAVQWAEQYFGVPILSAIVHLDEPAPHCHLILLPLIGGRMQGSDLMGSKARLRAMHAHFYEHVGKRYGLSPTVAAKRASAPLRSNAALMIVNRIRNDHTALHDATVAAYLIEVITIDPEPLMKALGMLMPVPRPRTEQTFVALMTKPCRPMPT